MQQPANTTLPRRYGRFEVLEVLGRGGMATVYLALDPIIGRKLALKVLRIDEGMNDAEAAETRDRFEREFRAAGTLTHPNIVTIYDVSNGNRDLGQDDAGRTATFIAMEYIGGRSLRDLLKQETELDSIDVVNLAVQLGSALDYAHAAGIVHRDVKPANILLTEAGTPKITDFGIARARAHAIHLTQTGMVVGTPHYMSPEQVTGQAIDGRSDQFAMAVILYRILTGELPFTGDGPSTVLYNVVHLEPSAPREHRPGLPEAVDTVLLKALSKDPAERYPDCEALAEALRTALGVETGTGANVAYPMSVGALPLASPPAPPSPNWRKRLAPVAILLATTALAVLLGLFLASNLRDSTEATLGEDAVAPTAEVAMTVDVGGVEEGTEIWVNGRDSGKRMPGELLLTGSPNALVALELRRDGQSIAFREVELTDGTLMWELSAPPDESEPEDAPPPERTQPTRPKPAAPVSEPPAVTSGPVTRQITIVTDPPGAEVILNGEDVLGPTPTPVLLREGETYALDLSLDGHLDRRVSFDFPDDLRVSSIEKGELFLVLEPRTLAPGEGLLGVTAAPYDVELEVDGRTWGPARDLDVPLAAGTYAVILRSREVLLERDFPRLQVRAGERITLELPRTIPVAITTEPGHGLVTVDGQEIGNAPLTYEMVVGRHEFLVKWADGDASRRVRRRVTGRTGKLHFSAP